jgi:hypothetical protein
MWFVILKTLLSDDLMSDDPSAESAQPEMLLVADDANAAYLKSTPAAKVRADSPAVCPYTLPHPGEPSCRYRSGTKKHIYPCRSWCGRYSR